MYALFSIFSLKKKIQNFTFTLYVDKKVQLLNFVCIGFEVLFVDHAMMFVALTSKKWCYLNRSYFQDDNDVILYLTTLQ
jgi:hypothetical protein